MDPESPPYDELEEIVKNNLVTRALIRQGALESQNIEITEEAIGSSLAEMVEEAGGRDLFFRRYGISEDQESTVRDEIKITLRVEKFLSQLGEAAPGASDRKIESYFKEHRDDLFHQEEIEALHINEGVHCEHEAVEAYETMRTLRRRILEGADFAGVAQEHAENTREEDAGDGNVTESEEAQPWELGRFGRGNMLPEFETIAFSMAAGELSPVFQTQFGYHLVKVTDRQDQTPLTLEEARPVIAERLLDEARHDLVENWVKTRREESTIAFSD
ncbi:MAG: peptidylprolyl isomerase, partial [Verrucomicrobiales bacterium]